MNTLTGDESLDALLAGLLALMLGLVVLAAIISLITAICKWILFSRAGEPGWAAIIPVYNLFVQSKISFGDYRWAFAWLAVYIVNIVCTTAQNVVSGADSQMLALIAALGGLIGMVIGLAMAVVNGINTFFFAKAFGKSTLFCVLSLFFTPIMLIVMVIDKNNTQYIGYSDFGSEWYERIRSKF